MVRQLGVHPQFERKSRNLLLKIRDNPGIIKVNKEQEITVNDVHVPGSNFRTLFANMTARRANLNQPGIGEFLSALRQLGVKSDELSGRELRKMYGTSPVRAVHAWQTRLAALHQPSLATAGQLERDVAAAEEKGDEDDEEEAEPALTTPSRFSISGRPSVSSSLQLQLPPPRPRPHHFKGPRRQHRKRGRRRR